MPTLQEIRCKLLSLYGMANAFRCHMGRNNGIIQTLSRIRFCLCLALWILMATLSSPLITQAAVPEIGTAEHCLACA